jgi:hypothetical protein
MNSLRQAVIPVKNHCTAILTSNIRASMQSIPSHPPGQISHGIRVEFAIPPAVDRFWIPGPYPGRPTAASGTARTICLCGTTSAINRQLEGIWMAGPLPVHVTRTRSHDLQPPHRYSPAPAQIPKIPHENEHWLARIA